MSHTHSEYAPASHTHDDLAPKSNPEFTGTPKAPTASDTATGTTQIATLAWVITRITNWWNGIKSNYALASHTHSGYASANHNHDSAYASKSHDHSGIYQPAGSYVSMPDYSTELTNSWSGTISDGQTKQIYAPADCWVDARVRGSNGSGKDEARISINGTTVLSDPGNINFYGFVRSGDRFDLYWYDNDGSVSVKAHIKFYGLR